MELVEVDEPAALRGLTASYAKDPPPATFRLEVSPLVSWIWIGGVLVLLGGILAGWPSPRGLTRLASARYSGIAAWLDS